MKFNARAMLILVWALLSLMACDGSSSEQQTPPESDTTLMEDIEVSQPDLFDGDSSQQDTGLIDSVVDTNQTLEDMTKPPKDTLKPPEDTTKPPKDTQAQPEDTETSTEDTLPVEDSPQDDIPPTLLQAGSYDVHIPSDAAGSMGIALRVFHPGTVQARYSEGAPIFIQVPGGWNAGTLEPELADLPEATYGFISIRMLLPGGSEGTAKSGGLYDYRGPVCAQAIRDCLRYATGALADSDGLLITDRIPFALTTEVGIVGSSNGGNLTLVTLAEYGDELAPIRWFAAWESPIGDQYAAKEMANNPFYIPGTCTVTTCPMPGMLEALQWDPEGKTAPLGVSGIPPFPGSVYAEVQDAAPFVINEMAVGPGDGPDAIKLYPSTELANMLVDAQDTLWPNPQDIPSWLGIQPDENQQYWEDRDGVLHVAEVHQNLPELLVIHVNTIKNHGQTSIDLPHARSHIQAWIDVDHSFVRLNPDAAYMAMVAGVDESALPDNDANTPVPWPGLVEVMIPESVEGVPVQNHMVAAGLELADRVHLGNLSTNLEVVLVN